MKLYRKTSTTVEVEAATGKEAVDKALSILGCTRDEVDIYVLKEEKKGLFGLEGASPAKVKVSIKEPTLPHSLA